MQKFSLCGLRNELFRALTSDVLNSTSQNLESIYSSQANSRGSKEFLHCSEKRYSKSRLLISFSAFRYSRIVRAVHSSSYSDWLLFCYSDHAPSAKLIHAILNRFVIATGKKIQKRMKDVLFFVCQLACLHKKNEINNLESFSQTEIARQIGVDARNWFSRWSSKWKLLLRIIDEFDFNGLSSVHESTRSRKVAARNAVLPLPRDFQTRSETAVFA